MECSLASQSVPSKLAFDLLPEASEPPSFPRVAPLIKAFGLSGFRFAGHRGSRGEAGPAGKWSARSIPCDLNSRQLWVPGFVAGSWGAVRKPGTPDGKGHWSTSPHTTDWETEDQRGEETSPVSEAVLLKQDRLYIFSTSLFRCFCEPRCSFCL